jgi:16S rRNA (cytidine1402-2'-O)-methyltransferase
LNSVTILGFPPIKAKARTRWFENLATVPGTVVFFEAPHRIASTLADLRDRLGKRQICVGRELTKTHQEYIAGPADGDMFLAITRKGEFSVVISPVSDVEPPQAPISDEAIVEEFRALGESLGHSGKRGAAGEVARRLGLTANEVYKALERAKV